MSRGYNARRKAKRRQVQAAAESPSGQSPTRLRPAGAIVPIVGLAAVFAAIAILGLGGSNGPSPTQGDPEVSALLAGIPQRGATLGSPKAEVTVQMFADLECLTVKGFVESYLPSIISTWVRTGDLKIEYRSLKTDTTNEHTFFRQEEAALAAGRQNKMWNFALTFVHHQGQHFTDYATDAFLGDIASRVPGLNMDQWNRDREDIALFKPIALSIHSAHAQGMHSTPSFVISGSASTRREIKSSLDKDLQTLSTEASGDRPILRVR